MVAILVLDLALVGLLLTANVGRTEQADRAGHWFAASLATGMLTLCAPWLAPQHAGDSADMAFVLCNAAGLLVGPCLILHARALAARYSNDFAEQKFPPLRLWLPIGLALLVYAATGMAGITPVAFELWMAIGKAVSLVISVIIAIKMIVGCRQTASAGFGRHTDLWFTIAMVMLGRMTLPAALFGGEAMAQMVYNGAVLPALGISLWLLTCLRLRGYRPFPASPETPGSPASSIPIEIPTDDLRNPAPEDAILASVYEAL